MNLRKNKGFTGIDISITMLIILIFIPTIFGISYNIQKTNHSIERESEAIDIMVLYLENAKSQNFDDIQEENITCTRNKVNYKVAINVSYPSSYVEGEEYYAKIVKVTVEYPVGNSTKALDMSTVIQKS